MRSINVFALAAAVADLSRARGQLAAAEQYAVHHDGDNPACFRAFGPDGGSDFPWGVRAQGSSNRDIWHLRAWVDGLIAQLDRDNRDYDGHKAAAISDLQAARAQMFAAERFAMERGHESPRMTTTEGPAHAAGPSECPQEGTAAA